MTTQQYQTMIKTIDRYENKQRVVYYLKNDRHRANGPAIEWKDGQWDWVMYDKWHRYYGPQSQKQDWWIHGKWVKNA
jgi:hypothetical protein